jgi:hypothetical protein
MDFVGPEILKFSAEKSFGIKKKSKICYTLHVLTYPTKITVGLVCALVWNSKRKLNVYYITANLLSHSAKYFLGC